MFFFLYFKICIAQVENGKKTLILQGTKTSNVLNAVLTEIYQLKKGSAVRYTRKNENIRPFESGGETSLEFFSLKTDCSLFVVSRNLELFIYIFFWVYCFEFVVRTHDCQQRVFK